MEDGIFISQSKNAKNILKKFILKNSRYKRTPGATHVKLSKDEQGVSIVQSLCKSIIDSLLYLTINLPYVLAINQI